MRAVFVARGEGQVQGASDLNGILKEELVEVPYLKEKDGIRVPLLKF
jgi:hypothetical protein